MRQATNIIGPLTNLQSYYLKFKNQMEDTSKARFYVPAQTNEIKPNQIIQIYNPKKEIRKQYYQNARQYLKNEQFAIILFAGGYGTRAETQKSKQFTRIMGPNQSSTTLFDITLEKLEGFLKYKVILYIVCSRKNHKQVIDKMQQILKKYKSLTIYLCYQPDQNVLDWNGLQKVYKNQNQRLTFPCGIGAFRQAKIYYSQKQSYTLQNHIKQMTKPQFVYCVGTSNYLQSGIDLEMLGLMVKNDRISCLFKCGSNIKNNEKQNLPIVCVREVPQNPPAWVVMQYNNLSRIAPNPQMIKNCPIWLDNFIFRSSLLYQDNKFRENQSQIKYEFNKRILQNRNKNSKLQCIIAQHTISYSLLRDKINCIGYLQVYQEETNFFVKTSKDVKDLQTAGTSLSSIVQRRRV